MRARVLNGFSPFPLFGNPASWSIRFYTPGADDTGTGAGAGAGGGGGGGTVVDGKDTTAADKPADKGADGDKGQMPYAEAKKLIAERDRAKAVNQAISDALSLETSWETGEDGKPKPVIKGLDDLKNLRQQAITAKEEALKKAGKWDEHKNELNRLHQEELARLTNVGQRKVQGRERIIENLAVESPLQVALKDEGIIDSALGDTIQLLRGRLSVAVEEDEETGEARLTVQPKGDDGKPMLDAKGNPLSVKQFVADWMSKRPHLKQANVRRGPGAGGYGAGADRMGGSGNGVATGGDAAADFAFGKLG